MQMELSARRAILAISLVVIGCTRSATEPSMAQPTNGGLPEVPGFSADLADQTSAYTRRLYRRDGEQVSVTLAPFPMTVDQYREWVRMSTESYSQAALDVDGSEGNGFYQCRDENPDRCDLLIQLRCGLHVEIRGIGTALKAHADLLAKSLDLRRRVLDCQPSSPASPGRG
jgi:hypothetical protein